MLAIPNKLPAIAKPLIVPATRAIGLQRWVCSDRPIIIGKIGKTHGENAVNKPPDRAKAIAQGAAFEKSKQNAQGFHFLAVQTSPEEEHFAGFWMLKEVVQAVKSKKSGNFPVIQSALNERQLVITEKNFSIYYS